MNTSSTIHISHRSTLLCEVLREALENRSYRVLGFSTTGADTLAKLNLYVPDIIIISNVLEGISGIEIAERAQKKNNACIFMSDDAAEAQAVNHRLKEKRIKSYVGRAPVIFIYLYNDPIRQVLAPPPFRFEFRKPFYVYRQSYETRWLLHNTSIVQVFLFR